MPPKRLSRGADLISSRRFTGGVLIGWISTFSAVAIGVFMSPFLVHHLGEIGYGVWALIQSTVGYMYFMDLGLRSTVVRFTAQDMAKKDYAGVNKVVSAALWIRLWTAFAIVLAGATLAFLLPHIFKVPVEYATTARVALVIIAVGLACTLTFSVFTALLAGMGRFDLLGLLEFAQTTITSLGLIPILLKGHGIIWMASWQFLVVLTVNVIAAITCFRTYPQLRLHLRKPEKLLLRALWSVGIYVLIATGAGQLILYTDNVVVGVFVTAAAVSYYAIAGKMVEYVRLIAISILKFFIPLASSFGALSEFDRLRKLHVRGTQAVLLVTFPIIAILVIRGHTLLSLWIGDRFASEATPILQVLACAAALMLASSTTNGITLALDKQKIYAWMVLGEGAANLVCSIVLVRRIGVLGVAIGTLLPTFFTSVLVWPVYVCRLIRLSTVRYLREAWLKPLLAIAPFIVANVWAQQHWPPSNLAWFVAQTIALLPFLALGALAVFWRDVPTTWRFITRREIAVNQS